MKHECKVKEGPVTDRADCYNSNRGISVVRHTTVRCLTDQRLSLTPCLSRSRQHINNRNRSHTGPGKTTNRYKRCSTDRWLLLRLKSEWEQPGEEEELWWLSHRMTTSDGLTLLQPWWSNGDWIPILLPQTTHTTQPFSVLIHSKPFGRPSRSRSPIARRRLVVRTTADDSRRCLCENEWRNRLTTRTLTTRNHTDDLSVSQVRLSDVQLVLCVDRRRRIAGPQVLFRFTA